MSLTKHRGIGGVIKQTPQDFVVREITSKGIVLEPERQYDAKSLGMEEVAGGKHISFVMQKCDWNTVDALLAIAKRMSRGRKSISYAGTKDKKAVTVQLASVYHPEQFEMNSIALKDIKINGFWRSDGVELGSDLGNAFEVCIRDVSNTEEMAPMAEGLKRGMPNYFGPQRFGERQNNPKVGAKILQGDFEGAVMEYLTATENERNAGVIEARQRLKENRDFKEALSYFPKFLRGERTVIAHLADYPNNYANALRKLPRGLALMFIHALQSQIFNEELDARIKNDDFKSSLFAPSDFYGFPDLEKVGAEGAFPVAALIGYETKEEEISSCARETMERMQLSKEAFRSNGLKELNMKGSYRPLLAPVRDFGYRIEDSTARLSFSLPKGSYATVLLDEFMLGS